MCWKALLSALGLAHQDDSRASESLIPGDNGDHPQKKFKVVGTMALAVKRFQAALNPSVDFARKGDSFSQGSTYQSPDVRSISAPHKSFNRWMSSTGSTSLGSHSRTITEGGPVFRRTPTTRGHMTSYLFKPLGELAQTI